MSVPSSAISDRLQAALDAYASVGDGCWTYNVAQDFLRLTDDWARQLGYSSEQASDPGFFPSILNAEDAPRVLAGLRALGCGDSDTLRDTFRLHTARGDQLRISCRGTVVERNKDGSPAVAAGLHFDTSGQSAPSSRLHDDETNFRQVFDNMPAAMCILDLHGSLQRINRKFEELTGYSEEEVAGQNARLFEASSRSEEDLGSTIRTIRENGSARLERTYRKKDGSHFWANAYAGALFDEAGQPEWLLGVLHDETERHDSEIRLRRALRELDAILENCLTGIAVMRGNTLTRVNRRMAEILGYRPSELDGMHARDLHISMRHYRNFLTLYSRHLSTTRFINIEYPVRRKDGAELWCRISGKAVDRRNPSKGVVWCCEDVTEERESKLALRKYADELLEAQKAQREHAMILSRTVQELDEAVRLADRIRKAFAATTLRPHGREDHRTLSVGVAQLRSPETLAELISRADSAMYDSKHGGKNSTCIAN